MFITLVGMRLFSLRFAKHDDGSWTVYNTKVFFEASKVLKELKEEMDVLTRKVILAEKKVELLKEENANLKELKKTREEQVDSLASAIEEHSIHSNSNDLGEKLSSFSYSDVIVRKGGLKEESEEAIRRSAEMLNQILVKERKEDS